MGGLCHLTLLKDVMLTCVPCKVEHIGQLQRTLRQEDREELTLASGLPAEMSLTLSFMGAKKSFAVLDGKTVLCVFGVTPHLFLKDVGIPWMICSKEFDGISRQFARECRTHIRSLFTDFRILKNRVYAGNKKALRWLQWCGARVSSEAVPHGPEGALFIPFWFDKNV